MLFERIESKGLAHYSYIVGDGTEAIVIDPRRDCDVYVQMATRAGIRIAHVLETQRNEVYVVGSVELTARTGAQIWHADAHHIHVTQLPHRLDEVPRDQTITIFCGSDVRATTAASLLQRAGWTDLAVVLGGLSGWSSTTCPLEL